MSAQPKNPVAAGAPLTVEMLPMAAPHGVTPPSGRSADAQVAASTPSGHAHAKVEAHALLTVATWLEHFDSTQSTHAVLVLRVSWSFGQFVSEYVPLPLPPPLLLLEQAKPTSTTAASDVRMTSCFMGSRLYLNRGGDGTTGLMRREPAVSRWARLAPLAFALVACSSRCGSSAARATPDAGASEEVAIPLPANVIPVPLVRQMVDYSCGDVAALALLRYWDPSDYASVGEADLYAPLHTTAQDGTDPQPITEYLKTVRGLSADFRLGATVADLTAAIDHGEPPIVDLEAWRDDPGTPDVAEWAADWDDGHYAVLVGYDDRDFYLMDPSTGDHYAYVPRGELEPRWHDVLTGSNAHIEHAAIFVRSSARGGVAAHLAAHDAIRMR